MKNTERLILILVLLGSSIVLAGPGAGGGGNPVEAQFEIAHGYLKKSFEAYSDSIKSKLAESSRNIIEKNLGQLIAEINSISIKFDHIATEPFKNANGADSGIQTQIGVPLSPIEVRSKVLAPQNEISLNLALTYLGHEIGHHLPPVDGLDEEQKAWRVSSALTQLMNLQMTAPELLTASGEYVSDQLTCRDRIHVEADPYSGRLSIAASTSNNSLNNFRCNYRPYFYTLEAKPSGTYLFKFDPRDQTYHLISSSNENDVAELFMFSDSIQIHWKLGGYAGGNLMFYNVGVKYRKN